MGRYEEDGLGGLLDRCLSQVSARRAPTDEVLNTEMLYRERYDGWTVKHFYSHYRREHAGKRSYTWAKAVLQRAGLMAKAPGPRQAPPPPRTIPAFGNDAAAGWLDP